MGLGCRVYYLGRCRDILLRDVLKCVGERLIAVLSSLHCPSGSGLGCVPLGEEGLGHRRAVPGWMQKGRGLWTAEQKRRALRRGASGRTLKPRGLSQAADTLAQLGRAGERRAGLRGAVGLERRRLRSGGT